MFIKVSYLIMILILFFTPFIIIVLVETIHEFENKNYILELLLPFMILSGIMFIFNVLYEIFSDHDENICIVCIVGLMILIPGSIIIFILIHTCIELAIGSLAIGLLSLMFSGVFSITLLLYYLIKICYNKDH